MKPIVLKWRIVPILALLFFWAHHHSTNPPRVLNVEPPGWWSGHSIDPVRLMIRGSHLSGATLSSPHRHIQTGGRAKVNRWGTYLWTDIHLSKETVPGSYPLAVHTDSGSVQVPFEVLAPLPRQNRFQGLTSDDIIYLLMPDRFANGDPSNDDPVRSPGMYDRSNSRFYHGGDLQGVIDRLPYLKDLGITAIWLNPIYDNADTLTQSSRRGPFSDYHGYGAVDYYAVDEHFGDTNLFRELVDRAHDFGIKIIQDQVANHTGPRHPWVHDPPAPDWFHGTLKDHVANSWKIEPLTDPSASPDAYRATLDGWFADILPDLNQDNEETERYLIQNTLWWIGVTGIDGIRQDTLPYAPRRFWSEWSKAIETEYPQLTVVGEAWHEDAKTVAFFQGGRARFDGINSGVTALFDFPLHRSLRNVFGETHSFQEIVNVLDADEHYTDPTMLVTFLESHDVPRFMHGDRADIDSLKLAFTFLMTTRGIPMIYYGGEIAMTGGGDPDNRRDFPGGWPGDPVDAFTQEGRTPMQQNVFGHVRKLTRLRAELEPLRRGRTFHLFTNDLLLVYARVMNERQAIIAINNATVEAKTVCPLTPLEIPNGTVLQDRIGVHSDLTVVNAAIELSLPPRRAAVFTIQE